MENREELGLGCAIMESMDHMTFACVCTAAWAARTLLSAGFQSLLLYLAPLSSFHFTSPLLYGWTTACVVQRH